MAQDSKKDQGQGQGQAKNEAGGLGQDADAGTAPDTDTDDKAASAAGQVHVIHGANSQTFDNLAGSSVSEIRETLTEVFNIPPDAQALVNGDNIGERYTLKPQDTLEFIKQAGVKGYKLIIIFD